MKRKFLIALSGVLICLTQITCKKPLQSVNLNINNDIIQYRASVQVFDETNPNITPANVTIAISGRDADYIYDVTGNKDFSVHNGGLQIGVSPALSLSSNRAVSFAILVSADGYLPVTQNVTIVPGQKNQTVGIAMTNLLNPRPGITIRQTTLGLSGGALTTPGILKNGKVTKDSTYYDDKITTVVLPAGTTFYYYKTITDHIVGTKVVSGTSYRDTVWQSGGATLREKIPTSYYDTLHNYDSTYVARVAYTGSTVNVVCSYKPGVSTAPYYLYDYDPTGAGGPQYSLYNGDLSHQYELMFTSAVKDALYDIEFIGKVDIGGGHVMDLNISPDSAAHWFTSFVIDSTVTNPGTHKHITEGDVIEWGIDRANNTTMKTVIKRSNIGDLRAEVQGVNVGYYFKAPYTIPLNFNFDASLDPNLIPDAENLNPYALVQLSSNIQVFPVTVYGPTHKIACSIYPPSAVSALLYLTYWGKSLIVKDVTAFNNTNNTIKVYDQANFLYALQPAVDISYHMHCDTKQKDIWPTYNFTIQYNNGASLFYCDMVDGHWKTRGLVQGQTYTIMGYMCNFSISKPYTVNGTTMAITDNIPEICNCILK